MSLLGLDVKYSKKDKKRVKYGILGSAVIVIVVMAALLTRPPLLDPLPGKISVSMTAQVYRDGALVAERVKDDDLLLNSFLNLTMGLFSWPEGSEFSIDMYSSSEMGLYDFVVWNTTASETIWDTTLQSEEGRAMADYGEGTTAPARDDDETGMEDRFLTDNVYEVAELGTDAITITFIETSDGSYDWSEVGLQKFFYCHNDDFVMRIWLCRDTFTPISVILGDSLVINYRFTFGTGYTSNALSVFYGLLLGGAQDTDTTVTLTDSGGSSRTVRLYTDDQTDEDFYGHVSNTLYGGWMTITDSASGIPSRSAYRLLGSSVTTQSESLVDGDPNYDVTVSATLIPSTAITVRCAGSFMYLSYVGGSGYFLMWALSHSGVYVASGTPVQSTFTLEL